jgi:hypothetical protein
MDTPVDRQAVYDGYARARRVFRERVEDASPDYLSRPSNGTRWTNKQLLFHLLFGYLVVRALRRLVKVMGVLPAPVTRGYAAVLDAATRPFNAMNYLGSVVGARFYSPRRMADKLDRVTAQLADRLARESETSLGRGMHLPRRWDPFFVDHMSLGEIYHYPTLHFEFHARQLS